MSRGLHLLGYDWTKGASAMTAALADGLSKSAKPSDTKSAGQKPPAPPETSNIAWYVGGAAVVAVLVAWLVKR